MNDKRMFHFFIGPVHEFVASARRTRDFQAGSLLLSWLSAVGALAAERQPGSKNLFPQLDHSLKNALLKGGEAMASMPNRFSIEVGSDFDPEAVENAVSAAWSALADRVWERDIALALSDEQKKSAKTVWDRQVNNFWEIYWIVAPESALFAMDWRKNWRTPPVLEEPGAKCAQMTGWQELSGIEGMKKGDIEKRRAFWAVLKKQLGNDLQEGEQLSAIALIKRRMYRHFETLEVSVSSGFEVHGLKMTRQVPSTPFLAAYPALEKLNAKQGQDGQLRDSLDMLDRLYQSLGGEHGEMRCWPEEKPVNKALLLDGQAWFEKTYDNPAGYGLKVDKKALGEAKALVKDIWKKVGTSPQPFYALLSMDGDGLGKQMGDRAKRPFISKGLAMFTAQVPNIVKQHKGHLIYAGGDDVLALLPVPHALGCAAALRTAYLKAFETVNAELAGQSEPIQTTLSGAVLFAHYDRPLNRMLDRAFELMESVSKDLTGRDALTVEVLKPSGRHLLWTQPWRHILAEKHGRLIVESLAEHWRVEDETSHKLFYRIVEYLDRLAPELRFNRDMSNQASLHGMDRAELVNQTITQMWTVALKQSGVNVNDKDKDLSGALEAIRQMIDQCRPVRRREDGELEVDMHEVVRPDGALLVKFLMHNGELK